MNGVHRKKKEWEERLYGKITTEMRVYGVRVPEMAKIMGMNKDTLTRKLNNPKKFSVEEFFWIIDYLHLSREEIACLVCPKEAKMK